MTTQERGRSKVLLDTREVLLETREVCVWSTGGAEKHTVLQRCFGACCSARALRCSRRGARTRGASRYHGVRARGEDSAVLGGGDVDRGRGGMGWGVHDGSG